LPKTGRTSIARRSLSCASPQSASCFENFAIPLDVLGQTLNAILKSPSDKRAALIAIAMVVGGWFVQDLRTYGVSKFMDAYLMPEQKKALSDDDIDRIAKRLHNVMDGKIAKEPVQQVYRELERDKAIKSVGTVSKPGTKPANPVPREQFQTAAGILPPAQTTPKKRKKTSRERLTLISPVLIEGPRHWRFRSSVGEFGYTIEDEKFLKSLLSGRRKIPMKEGIQILRWSIRLKKTKARFG
jgi:hypothetical protein